MARRIVAAVGLGLDEPDAELLAVGETTHEDVAEEVRRDHDRGTREEPARADDGHAHRPFRRNRTELRLAATR